MSDTLAPKFVTRLTRSAGFNEMCIRDRQEVRSNIGYVLQEPALFSGTIKSNITFGIDASDDEVERVLEMIGAKKFVKDYPDGIHTKLEYLGSNLSTGEKQLISFARILLRNPAILILDEATAKMCIRDSNYYSNQNGRVYLANSLWLKKGLKINSEYLNFIKDNFYAQSYEIDFIKRKEKDKIIKWINYYTENVLKLDRNNYQIEDNLALLLLNTIYFDNKWLIARCV